MNIVMLVHLMYAMQFAEGFKNGLLIDFYDPNLSSESVLCDKSNLIKFGFNWEFQKLNERDQKYIENDWIWLKSWYFTFLLL